MREGGAEDAHMEVMQDLRIGRRCSELALPVATAVVEGAVLQVSRMERVIRKGEGRTRRGHTPGVDAALPGGRGAVRQIRPASRCRRHRRGRGAVSITDAT